MLFGAFFDSSSLMSQLTCLTRYYIHSAWNDLYSKWYISYSHHPVIPLCEKFKVIWFIFCFRSLCHSWFIYYVWHNELTLDVLYTQHIKCTTKIVLEYIHRLVRWVFKTSVGPIHWVKFLIIITKKNYPKD